MASDTRVKSEYLAKTKEMTTYTQDLHSQDDNNLTDHYEIGQAKYKMLYN